MTIRRALFGYHRQETETLVRRLQDRVYSLEQENRALREQLKRTGMKIDELQTLLDVGKEISRLRQGETDRA
ncbi:MAG: hypothetical protein ACOYJY_04190 [Acutalibacteraceae bacterium]|jgi:predicted nuclease with TOPRIM domain